MKLAINLRNVALEIVEVLHKNEIPIAMAQSVFNEAMHLANAYTIPYSPSSFKMNEDATCTTVDSVTEPKG